MFSLEITFGDQLLDSVEHGVTGHVKLTRQFSRRGNLRSRRNLPCENRIPEFEVYLSVQWLIRGCIECDQRRNKRRGDSAHRRLSRRRKVVLLNITLLALLIEPMSIPI